MFIYTQNFKFSLFSSPSICSLNESHKRLKYLVNAAAHTCVHRRIQRPASGKKFLLGGPNLPRFSTFSADLGHLIFLLPNFDTYFYIYVLFFIYFGQIFSSTYDRSVGSQCCCAACAMSAGATFRALKSRSHRNQSYFLGYTLVSLISLISKIRLACASKCQSQKFQHWCNCAAGAKFSGSKSHNYKPAYFIMAPSFSLSMICHILHGGCNFFFHFMVPISFQTRLVNMLLRRRRKKKIFTTLQ